MKLLAAFGLSHHVWENSAPSQVATEFKLLECSHTAIPHSCLANPDQHVWVRGSPDVMPSEEQLKLGITINEVSLYFYNKKYI